MYIYWPPATFTFSSLGLFVDMDVQSIEVEPN